MLIEQMTPPQNGHHLEGNSLHVALVQPLGGFQIPWLGLEDAPKAALHLRLQTGLVTFLSHCSQCILTVPSAAALRGQGGTCRGPNRRAQLASHQVGRDYGCYLGVFP